MKRLQAMTVLLCVPLAVGAVQLRYGWQTGQELRYRETVSAKGAMTVESALGEQNLPLELRAVEERSLKTVAPADRESWWLDSRSLSGQATTTVQGESSTEQTPGENLRLRVKNTGEVLEVKRLAPRQAGEMALDLRLDDVLAATRLAAFPEQDVQPGATWEREVPIVARDGRRLTARASSTLMRFRQAEGRNLAEIQTRYEVPIPPSEGKLRLGGLELPIRVEGRSAGTTTTAWDVAEGRSQSSYGTGKVDLKLTLTGLAAEPAQTRLDIQTRTNLLP